MPCGTVVIKTMAEWYSMHDGLYREMERENGRKRRYKTDSWTKPAPQWWIGAVPYDNPGDLAKFKRQYVTNALNINPVDIPALSAPADPSH
jgi:hypothetical protein